MPKRWSTIAACTVAVAASLGGSATDAHYEQDLSKIDRYCQTSWRNAGIAEQEWDDCTQQVMTDLLVTGPNSLQVAIQEKGSDEHRELKRAIWRTVKRWQRRPQSQAYDEQLSRRAMHDPTPQPGQSQWEEVWSAACRCLSPQQQQVIRLTRDGWSVRDIAEHLDLPADRVSDAKYRAIGKLKKALA